MKKLIIRYQDDLPLEEILELVCMSVKKGKISNGRNREKYCHLIATRPAANAPYNRHIICEDPRTDTTDTFTVYNPETIESKL